MIFGPNTAFILVVFLLALLSGVAALGFLVMLPMLIFKQPLRHVLAYPWRYSLLGVLALALMLPGIGLYRFQKKFDAQLVADRAAHNPQLTTDLQLGDIRFPAGTSVKLENLEPLDYKNEPQPNGLESLSAATFGRPVSIRKLQVDALESPGRNYDAGLMLSHAQEVEGWPCRAKNWVDFRREIEDQYASEKWKFSSCLLNTPNYIAGVAWPQGSVVRDGKLLYEASSGGAQSPLLTYGAFQFSEMAMSFTSTRQMTGWRGALGAPASFGEWSYPAGTRVNALNPGMLIFSPMNDHDAHNVKSGETVSPGRSLIHHPENGILLGIKLNEDVREKNWSGIPFPSQQPRSERVPARLTKS